MRRKKERMITIDTPASVRELARFTGIGKSTVYRHLENNGYKFEYPRIRRSTPRHYLAWAQTIPETAPEAGQEDLAPMEHELHRLRSAAGRSDAPPCSHGSQSALPQPGERPAGRRARSLQRV